MTPETLYTPVWREELARGMDCTRYANAGDWTSCGVGEALDLSDMPQQDFSSIESALVSKAPKLYTLGMRFAELSERNDRDMRKIEKAMLVLLDEIEDEIEQDGGYHEIRSRIIEAMVQQLPAETEGDNP